MTDTLGEDRLLDQVDTWLSSHTDAEPTLQLHKCADWLARLCDRVRHLEAEVGRLKSNDAQQVFEASHDRDVWREAFKKSEAASQRLTEAHKKLSAFFWAMWDAAREARDVEGDREVFESLGRRV